MTIELWQLYTDDEDELEALFNTIRQSGELTDPAIRRHIIHLATRHGRPTRFESIRDDALNLLKQFPDGDVVEPMLQLLEAEDERTLSAILILYNVGSAALEPILAALNHENPYMRGVAADILGDWRDERAIPALEARLHDSDRGVRWRVIETLGAYRDPRLTLDVIMNYLHDPDAWVRTMAMQTLAKIDDPILVVALREDVLNKLSTVDDATKRDIAYALGTANNPELQPILVALLDQNPSPDTYLAVVEAFRKTSFPDRAHFLKDFPRTPEPRLKSSGAYEERARKKLERLDFVGAIADATESIRVQWKRSAPYVLRGYARYLQGDWVGALQDFYDEWYVAPRQPGMGWFGRAKIHEKQQDLAGALWDINIMLKNAASLHEFQASVFFRSQLHRLRGNPLAADDDWRWLGGNRSPEIIYFNYGKFLLRLGDTQGAQAYFDEALRINPALVAAHQLLARLYQLWEDNPRAVEQLTLGIQHAPDAAELYHARAKLYRTLGQIPESDADYAAAHRLNPQLARLL